MDMLDYHRPDGPDHYGEGLLTEMVGRPFVLGEGINCEGFGKSCDAGVDFVLLLASCLDVSSTSHLRSIYVTTPKGERL